MSSNILSFIMSDYPLSTISSKKVKKSSDSLYEKSACQSAEPTLLNRQEYCHILKGERVFIQLYYQGKVIETAYNQWISFMGGILYKRLNPKVSILLTNSENQELKSVLERVRKTCPKCRVISILWFERCFQAKSKVDFEEFELDVESKTKKGESKESQLKQKIDLGILEGFFNNICEDNELQYKDFFKETKNSFEYTNKNYVLADGDFLMKAQDFDLGPNPNRRREKTKDNPERKRKRTTHSKNEGKKHSTTLEQKEEQAKFQGSSDKKQKNEEEQICQFQGSKEKEQKPQTFSFNLMMEKYLNQRQESKSSHSKIKQPEKEPSQKEMISKSPINQGRYHNSQCFSVLSNRTQLSYCPQVSKTKKDPLYSFSKRTNDPERMQEIQINCNLKSELQKLDEKLKALNFNQIVVISDSKSLSVKIEKMNQERKKTNQIELINIFYHIYIHYSEKSPFRYKSYYLLNPSKITDRPLYYALTCTNPECPSLVSYKFVNEVEHKNELIREGTLILDQKHLPNFRYLKELPFIVDPKIIKGKKIAFLQSEIPKDVLQLIVCQLQGIWMSSTAYLMGGKPDIVVTNRSSLPDPSVLTLCQTQLWKTVFPLNNS